MAIHSIFIDRKNDIAHCARISGIDCIHWSHFRRNPLCPPTSETDIYGFRSDFIKVFCELMQFWARGSSIFLKGVDRLYQDFGIYEKWSSWDWEGNTFPTLPDLLDLFKSREFRKSVAGQGVESLLSIIDKLGGLVLELEPIISCQKGFDIVRLFQEKRSLNYIVEGLGVEAQNFLILSEILQYAHYFKTHGPRNMLNALFFFDEAKGILGKTNKDNFAIKDLVSKIREWGIGLICADQIPSEISQFFFSNIGTLIMFRHSDGFDLQRLRYSSGASVEQILANYSLQPGEAIVRSMKSKDLQRIKIPFNPAEKYISRREVDELMAERLQDLHRDVIPYVKREKEQAKNGGGQTNGISLDEAEVEVLVELARDFNRPSSRVYEAADLSNSAGHRLKKRLLAKKCISQVTTSLGRDGRNAVFMIPNPVVFEMLGIELGGGRGGALHKHFQVGFKGRAEQLGFNAAIEESVNGTPEAPDVSLEKNDFRIAGEICVTSKPPMEATHIEKNFRLGFDVVILTFVNRRVLEKTRKIAAGRYSSETMEKVRFCLVNEFASILGEF